MCNYSHLDKCAYDPYENVKPDKSLTLAWRSSQTPAGQEQKIREPDRAGKSVTRAGRGAWKLAGTSKTRAWHLNLPISAHENVTRTREERDFSLTCKY